MALTGLGRAETIIGYRFQNQTLCRDALRVAVQDSNVRLAIVGDKVLDLVLVGDWYAIGDTKGQWNTVQQRLVNSMHLGNIGFNRELHECCINHPTNPVPVSEKIMVSTIKALIGAVYLDGGLNSARQVLTALGIIYNTQVVTSISLLFLPELLDYGLTCVNLVSSAFTRGLPGWAWRGCGWSFDQAFHLDLEMD